MDLLLAPVHVQAILYWYMHIARLNSRLTSADENQIINISR